MLIPDWAFRLRAELAGDRIAGTSLAEVFDPGQRPSPRAGPGLEWRGRREYVPGDLPNLIDWRTYARHADRDDPPIYVKTFDSELGNRTTLVVDCSTSMNIPEYESEGKLATALGTAALLATTAVEWGDPAELTLFGGADRPALHSSGLLRTVSNLDLALTDIEALAEPAGASSGWDLFLDPYSGWTGTRQTLVLISDFFVDLEILTRVLRHLHQRVRTLLAVRVLAPSDRDPFISDQNAEIYDVEDPGIRSRVAPDREAYSERLQAHLVATEDLLAEEGVPLASIAAIPLASEVSRSSAIVVALRDARILEPV